MEYNDTPQDTETEPTVSETTKNESPTEDTNADAGQETSGFRASADGRANTGTFQPPPPSMHLNGPRRLYRTTGPIGGVAGGLADYFGIDPVLVRLAIVAGAIIGFPLVPLVYVAAWMIIPQADPAPVAPLMAPNPAANPAPSTATAVVHLDAPAPSPESISAR